MDDTSRVLATADYENKLWASGPPVYALSDWYRERGRERAADVLLLCHLWGLEPHPVGPDMLAWGTESQLYPPTLARPHVIALWGSKTAVAVEERWGEWWKYATHRWTLFRRLWLADFCLYEWAASLEELHGLPRDGWRRALRPVERAVEVAGEGGG